MAKGQTGLSATADDDYSVEKKAAATTAKGTDEVEEKKAIADRIAIVKETFEKNKTLDKKDQKEISRDDMILAGLMPG